MKRKDLVRLLENNGWTKAREGANHEIYTKGNNIEMIPRHKEIAEGLAKTIIKRRRLK
ncbi:MAG TPA: type II toxin-antitoxin system HicA family toxin [Clostridia bacterium]|nr:type II toxin-antitoxin system HicA family toxin [Clostridia bacterium]